MTLHILFSGLIYIIREFKMSANNAVVSISSKSSNDLLKSMASGAAQSVSDYDLVKAFSENFNKQVVPMLKNAGIKARLKATFEENGTSCEIRKSFFMSSEYVASLNAREIRTEIAYQADHIS